MVSKPIWAFNFALLSLFVFAYGNPALTPGVWKDISPSGINYSTGYGSTALAIDPSNPSTIFCNGDQQGMWKSTDGGSNWTRVGTPPNAPNYSTSVNYLDYPTYIEIDPANSNHMYAAQGVRGTTLGFWVSTDAGATWNIPSGYQAISNTFTRDVGFMSVDPGDFNHVILASHDGTNRGIAETKDGGSTFTVHPPLSSWDGGTMGLNFLYNPALGIGNAQTWLVVTDGNGSYRTTNAGATWTTIPSFGGAHGGAQLYYSKTGVVYSGAAGTVTRSTDNGVTWKATSGMPGFYYYAICGDGNYLYTQGSYASAAGTNYNRPYSVSPESDGVNWSDYQGGTQKFANGPYNLKFDKINRIMYSANWCAGVWALKVLDPSSRTSRPLTAALQQKLATVHIMLSTSTSVKLSLSRNGSTFDIRGRTMITRRCIPCKSE